MPGPVFVTVAQSATTSAPFTIERAGAFAIFVPSLSPAAEVRVQFSADSGGASSGFADLRREDGSGIAFVATSGAGPSWCTVGKCSTPWGRVSLPSQPQLDVRTFALLPLAFFP